MNTEYEQISKSGLQGGELLKALTDFELWNPTHYASKVDLGNYYLLVNNYNESWLYLKRAEVIVSKAQKNATGNKTVCVMYGSLAQLALIKGELEVAGNYAQKAVTYDKKFGQEYQYVQAQIFLAQDKKQDALQLFESVYKEIPEKSTADDLQAYMYLLADARHFTECEKILDQYFEKGSYFSGLGMFASSVYEAVENTEKSVFCAFLDYEFYTSFNQAEDASFLENLERLSKQLKAQGNLEAALPAISLIQSLYDRNISSQEKTSDFFAATYCRLKKKTQTGTVTTADFNELLSLEKYFANFPVYYWTVWEMVRVLSPASLENYMTLLKKIIILAPAGHYAQKARLAVCDVFDLDPSQADKLDGILFK